MTAFATTLATLQSVEKTPERTCYRALVDDSWSNFRTVFGGMQQALALAAMRQTLGLPEAEMPLRSLQTNFIAPVDFGELEIDVAVLRQGKSVAQLEARILQGEQVACSYMACFGRARESQIDVVAPEYPQHIKAFTDSEPFPWKGDARPGFLQHYEQRLGLGAFPVSAKAADEQGIYVRFREDVVVDELALMSLTDVIPSPTLARFETFKPASSMNSLVEFFPIERPLAVGEPVLHHVYLRKARDGYASHDAYIWTPHGELIAYSHQTAVIFY